jgi:hypothetical protein
MKGDVLTTWVANASGVLTPLQAFGFGLYVLGMALCIHAFFYQRYHNHLEIKFAIVALGVLSVLFGFYLRCDG